MESFNANLQGGKKLVKSLEKQSVRAPPRMHACTMLLQAQPVGWSAPLNRCTCVRRSP